MYGCYAQVKRLAAQVDRMEGERRELLQSRAAERRAAAAAAAQLQAQLDAGKRRADHMVSAPHMARAAVLA